MNLMKSFPIFSFIKSMNVIPTFYFGRAVVKLSKMKGFPQNLKFYILIIIMFLEGINLVCNLFFSLEF